MSEPEGGRTVGRYRILGFLGSGAMGEVFLAEDPHIERRLAIKTVRLAGRPAEVEDRAKRLLREARAAGRLLHPNIVTLFDAGEAEGMLYLAFELVEGTDLAGRLESGPPLSLREVLGIVRQTAEALDYAHRQGIVHRDIKPSNLLLDAAGRVKVADFGIAKVSGQSTELTVTGSVMGSPQYLSPEQIRGDELDGRSDLFSLGVVLYELLSGKRPFEGETITTLVYQILHKEPPPVSALRSIPPRLEQLLRSLIAKDREERAATAGQVAAELAAIERELDDETLAAPASLVATTVLPRKTGAPVSPPSPFSTLPPLPPAAPTHRSAGPPPPPGALAPQGAPAVRPATGRAMLATEGIPAKRWLPLMAAAVLLVVLGAAAAGWMIFGADGAEPPPAGTSAVAAGGVPVQPAADQAAAPAAPATGPAPASLPAAGAPAGRSESSPAAQTPPRQEGRTETRGEAEARRPAPAQTQPPPVPRETRREEPGLPVAPAPQPTPEPEAPEGGRPRIEIQGEEEPAQPALPRVDQVMRTGLELSFRVTPPEAFVLVDRTQIGQAREWSGQKGARTYTLPGPGRYLIRMRSPGMKEYRIAVEASETAGVTPVFARLSALPAADVDDSDLPVVRVREAVAFRVRPPGAAILVNGQPAGTAMRYAGGLGARGWLKLPAGRHRVSVVTPGGRYDVLVEVTAGAEKERERIEVNLLGGGGR